MSENEYKFFENIWGDETALAQVCRKCNQIQRLLVPTDLWKKYRDGRVSVQSVFTLDEWDWAHRDVILGANRQHHGRWNRFYLCPHCMVEAELAEASEVPSRFGNVIGGQK